MRPHLRMVKWATSRREVVSHLAGLKDVSIGRRGAAKRGSALLAGERASMHSAVIAL